MILVIGGGPAGRLAAMRLARAGREVTLVERGGLGGQCLHHGCMVVCALSDVARTLRYARTLHGLGILDREPPGVSYGRLIAEMGKIQATITRVLDEETRSSGPVTVVRGEGSLDGRTPSIDGKPVEAEAVLAATGSRPVIPRVEGIDLPGVVTAHTLPAWKELPARIAVAGGGVMAAEFAHIFHAFGAEVTILARSTFLKGLDPHLMKQALRELEGVEICEHSPLSRIEGSGRAEAVVVGGEGREREMAADGVFLATGLTPNSGMIHGPEKGSQGEVLVDDHMQTSIPGVYAAGDVTGPPYLTPVARMEGLVAADNILGRERLMDYRCIPQSLTLMNEFAWCSLEDGPSAGVGCPSPAGPFSFWAVPSGNTGYTGIRASPGDGRILSAALASPGAAIVASYLSFLMRTGCTVQDFDEFLEVHPTTDGAFSLVRYLEEWMRLREREP
ncbi:MAG: NAD(P)/FAD-dependent oxidoreductase [Methanomicrobiales archaeon]|nr:NAD(P)/FAD-dependent oxidoreductase [Methanomicrobiales archaeon]